MTVLEKIKPNGYIPVPLSVLRKIGLKPGTEVILHTEKDSLVIEKPRKSIKHLRGRLKHIDFETCLQKLDKRWERWSSIPQLRLVSTKDIVPSKT